MRWIPALLTLALLHAAPARAQDLAEIEKLLTTTGVTVEVHGAVPGFELFAVTYRNPRSFFEFVHMSLVARDPKVAETLKGLARHDRVRIVGSFLPNPSPQKHILATSIEVVQKYSSTPAMPRYEYDGRIPEDLAGRRSGRFLVHIAQADDGILVVEHKDAVIPIFVQNKVLLRGLARNDVVQLRFDVRARPDRPTHLRLDETHREPLKVVNRITDKHGKKADMKGALVLFPKSPQIITNVFALLEELPGGLTRQYTLANLQNEKIFAAVRDKLQAAWDSQSGPGDYINGRNKLVSLKIKVRARGTFNQTDEGQANPQILLDSPDAITFDVKR